MSPLALLYDVHGNLPALEAVLADVRGADAQRVVLGGDYALFGPFPGETVAALRALPQATWIRGNVDRWAADPAQLPDDDELLLRAVADCREALGSEVADELGKLPEQVVVDGTRYCHASPVSDVRSFLPEPADDEDDLLEGVEERRLVFGHTHLPFRREARGGIELVNPGSVGMPFDGDTRAAYAVVRDGGEVEHRRVEYDSPATAARLVSERFGHGWADTVARRIEQASFAV
jgi:predicted phosphodiesterase